MIVCQAGEPPVSILRYQAQTVRFNPARYNRRANALLGLADKAGEAGSKDELLAASRRLCRDVYAWRRINAPGHPNLNRLAADRILYFEKRITASLWVLSQQFSWRISRKHHRFLKLRYGKMDLFPFELSLQLHLLPQSYII